jgi:tetratricopeptide (TPR) repeat protein
MTGVLKTDELYQRGYDLRCEGRYAEAREALMGVLREDPTHTDARWQLGLIKGFEGDFEGSLIILEALVDQHPDATEIRYDLAMTQMMLGMFDDARRHFEIVLAKDPTHKQAAAQLTYFEQV